MFSHVDEVREWSMQMCVARHGSWVGRGVGGWLTYVIREGGLDYL